MWESIEQAFRIYVTAPIAQDPFWEATALVGEIVFGGRFILQWIISEIKKRSYVPTAFWYMSIVGSIILLAYFIHNRQPVMIVTFALQILIYGRNLCLIRNVAHRGEDSA